MRFADLTEEKIRDILSDAIDGGDWHSPSVSNLQILEQNNSVVYGKFTSSLHNTFRDEERGFQINSDSVEVWHLAMEVNARGELVEKRRYHPIHNIVRLGKVIGEISGEPVNQ